MDELENVIVDQIVFENSGQQFASELLNVPILFGAFALGSFLIFCLLAFTVVWLLFEQLVVEENVIDAFDVVEIIFDCIVLLYRIH